MIQLINRKDYEDKNLPIPFEAVSIGRGSPLGNPWSHNPYTSAIIVKTRSEAIGLFRSWLLRQLTHDTPARREIYRLVELHQKTEHLMLVCHCVPLECHGEVIKQTIEFFAKKG